MQRARGVKKSNAPGGGSRRCKKYQGALLAVSYAFTCMHCRGLEPNSSTRDALTVIRQLLANNSRPTGCRPAPLPGRLQSQLQPVHTAVTAHSSQCAQLSSGARASTARVSQPRKVAQPAHRGVDPGPPASSCILSALEPKELWRRRVRRKPRSASSLSAAPPSYGTASRRPYY